MKKILVLLSFLVLITSCGAKTDKIENSKIEKKKTEQKVEEKFGDLTKYIKADITDTESKKLSEILEERKIRQAEVKKMIEDATKENKEEVYKKIVEKRKICTERISVYVSEDKISSFKKYCERVNFMIKKKLDEK